MKILYTGGGTMGSVSPLIAIHQKLKEKTETRNQKLETLWLGTKFGPEREVIESEGINFKPILSGKFRRYFALQNFLDIFKIKLGFWQALFIILKFKPDLILTAGSFVAVPVAWAGWFCNVPIIAHQQDVRVGLANKLIAPIAKKITVALEKSLADFNIKKTVLAGNPIRNNIFLSSRAEQSAVEGSVKNNFDFKNDLPVVLIIGGGTGALAINELVCRGLAELTKVCNIIHLTGRNKCQSVRVSECQSVKENYKYFEFLNAQEVAYAYHLSDIVISRAGMSALTELAYFAKPTIIIPIFNSHQEDNAKYFAERHAAIYLSPKELNPEKFANAIKNLLANKPKQKELGEQINKIFIDYGGEKIIDLIFKVLKKD